MNLEPSDIYFTTDELPTLTRREIIEKSVRHVLKNGKPSMEGNKCVYLGIGCGAAPFLTIEGKQFGDANGYGWEGMVSGNHSIASGHSSSHEYETIAALQRCHDTVAMTQGEGREFIPTYTKALVAAGLISIEDPLLSETF